MIDDATLNQWMESALEIARVGTAKGESPFGAVVVTGDGVVIAAEHNRVNSLLFPNAHAEVLAIQTACAKIGRLDLSDCWLVATGEPCSMCAATAAIAGVARLAYGASECVIEEVGYETLGLAAGEFFLAIEYKLEIRGGIQRCDCEKLLREFPKNNTQLHL